MTIRHSLGSLPVVLSYLLVIGSILNGTLALKLLLLFRSDKRHAMHTRKEVPRSMSWDQKLFAFLHLIPLPSLLHHALVLVH